MKDQLDERAFQSDVLINVKDSLSGDGICLHYSTYRALAQSRLFLGSSGSLTLLSGGSAHSQYCTKGLRPKQHGP